MAEATANLEFVGRTGDFNFDVADATGSPPAMHKNQVYEVPESLARRLVLSADWRPADGDQTAASDEVSYVVDNSPEQPQPGEYEWRGTDSYDEGGES